LGAANFNQIPNRTQFRHVIFGPQLWSGYDEAYFPAIRDIVEVKDWQLANKYVHKTGQLLKEAASRLLMG
jgi:N-acetylated-alpha-linked acidic dipeptidase